MKKFIVILSLVLTTNLFAIKSSDIQTVMNQNIQTALKILSDEQLHMDDKVQKLYTMFDPLFNYELMAKLSLGGHWKSLSDEQKEEFVTKFVAKLKNSYKDTLTQYKDEVIEINGMQESKNRIKLLSTIISQGQKYEVIYKFYKAGEDEWFIYDLDILGVSIVQSFRNQFAGYKNESFEKLLELLKNNSI